MSEHKKLVRLAARAFYRHSSTKERLARTGNAKHDNSRIAEVLIDALTRRTWIKEDDLARAILLNPKQVRKALHYLEEERIVTRSHVKEKDKDREARTRMRAEEHGVDEGIIMERIRNIDKKTVSYVCLNYSRVVDALNLRIGTARAELKFKIEKGPVTVLYRCTNDPETCGRRYSSLDAMRLIDFKTGAFVCQLCQWEVVQLGGGEDGAPAEPKTKAGLQAILDKFERQIAPVQRQLARVKGATPPQYGTLNEWTKAGTRGFVMLACFIVPANHSSSRSRPRSWARRRAADRAAAGGAGAGGGGRAGGLGVQYDELEETKFEVTLGLTQEQEAAAVAEANAPSMQPAWITRNQFEKEDNIVGGGGGGGGSGDGSGGALQSAAAAAEEQIQQEWLKAYLAALQGAQEEELAGPPAAEATGTTGVEEVGVTEAVHVDGETDAAAAAAAAAALETDALVAEAMGITADDIDGDDQEWDDVDGEDADWEDA